MENQFIWVKCSFCGRDVKVAPELVGKKIRCLICKTKTTSSTPAPVSTPIVTLPSLPKEANLQTKPPEKIKSGQKGNYLWVFLYSILGCGMLSVIGLTIFNHFRLNDLAQMPSQPEETRIELIESSLRELKDDLTRVKSIESLYQTVAKELEDKQQLIDKLTSDLTKLNDIQNTSYGQLLEKIRLSEIDKAADIEGIRTAIEKIEQFQVKNYEKLEAEIAQLKSGLARLHHKLLNTSDELGKKPVQLGAEILPGAYTIKITDAVITSTDWTDNDLGTKAVPPDCFVVIYQNDKEIFISKVRLDTRNPTWNEEFILNWENDDKLEIVIYDMDAKENQKILGWDNSENKRFLFNGSSFVSPHSSYLNYEVLFAAQLKEGDDTIKVK